LLGGESGGGNIKLKYKNLAPNRFTHRLETEGEGWCQDCRMCEVGNLGEGERRAFYGFTELKVVSIQCLKRIKGDKKEKNKMEVKGATDSSNAAKNDNIHEAPRKAEHRKTTYWKLSTNLLSGKKKGGEGGLWTQKRQGSYGEKQGKISNKLRVNGWKKLNSEKKDNPRMGAIGKSWNWEKNTTGPSKNRKRKKKKSRDV